MAVVGVNNSPDTKSQVDDAEEEMAVDTAVRRPGADVVATRAVLVVATVAAATVVVVVEVAAIAPLVRRIPFPPAPAPAPAAPGNRKTRAMAVTVRAAAADHCQNPQPGAAATTS